MEDRVDDEACSVDRIWAWFLKFAFFIDQQEVRNLDKAEVFRIWICSLMSTKDVEIVDQTQLTYPKQRRVNWV